MGRGDNIILVKSKAFALRIIKVYQYLRNEQAEYVMSNQLLKSGTSVGANVKEAVRGQSKADFTAKMCISLKEISETEYWLELLHESGYISSIEFDSLHKDCEELIRLLTAIIKTSKSS